MIFIKKLSTMVKAGLPVLDSLKMVESQTDQKALKKIVGTISKDLESGVSLSKCFDKHPKAFDNVAINMLKAGKASGKTYEVPTHIVYFWGDDNKIDRASVFNDSASFNEELSFIESASE